MNEVVKFFSVSQNIGTAKYVVSYHNGNSFYDDGSPFSDIAIFKNKKLLNNFVKGLKESNYIENYVKF